MLTRHHMGEVRPGLELVERVQTPVEWAETMWLMQMFGCKVEVQVGAERVDSCVAWKVDGQPGGQKVGCQLGWIAGQHQRGGDH